MSYIFTPADVISMLREQRDDLIRQNSRLQAELEDRTKERDNARQAVGEMRGLLETAIHVRDVGLDRFGVQMQVTDEWYDKARELTKE